jgi:hypothetical protein
MDAEKNNKRLSYYKAPMEVENVLKTAFTMINYSW